VSCETGGLVLVIEYADRSADPVCDDCAEHHDGPLLALLVCKRIAAEPCYPERVVPMERETPRSPFHVPSTAVQHG
jgi:hypothetical protein